MPYPALISPQCEECLLKRKKGSYQKKENTSEYLIDRFAAVTVDAILTYSRAPQESLSVSVAFPVLRKK